MQLLLASVVEIYKVGKVRTVMMLRVEESRNQDNPPDIRRTRKWKVEVETDDILSSPTHHGMVGATQVHRITGYVIKKCV